MLLLLQKIHFCMCLCFHLHAISYQKKTKHIPTYIRAKLQIFRTDCLSFPVSLQQCVMVVLTSLLPFLFGTFSQHRQHHCQHFFSKIFYFEISYSCLMLPVKKYVYVYIPFRPYFILYFLLLTPLCDCQMVRRFICLTAGVYISKAFKEFSFLHRFYKLQFFPIVLCPCQFLFSFKCPT